MQCLARTSRLTGRRDMLTSRAGAYPANNPVSALETGLRVKHTASSLTCKRGSPVGARPLAAARGGRYTPTTPTPSHGPAPMNEVTRILAGIEQGDPQAAAQLLSLVYDELRKLAAHRLAQEKAGQTL